MAKYLVPMTGHLIIEAESDKHAEIMALMWSHSLVRRTGAAPAVVNNSDLIMSQHGVRQDSSAKVSAVSLSFPRSQFRDLTDEFEPLHAQAAVKDSAYRAKKGLSELDLTPEQLVLFSLGENLDPS